MKKPSEERDYLGRYKKGFGRKPSNKPPTWENVHAWLNYHYTKQNCMYRGCEGKSKKLDFALINGRTYDKIRENFVVLCRRCHKFYDRVIVSPERLSIIVKMRSAGVYWKEIARIVGSDFRNVSRDYRLFRKRAEMNYLDEQASKVEE